METINKIAEAIEQADTICIFRHQFPDQDAIGSQMGLKTALQSLYPKKKVLALGTMSVDGIVMDTADDATIQNALAIVLDTANQARIDDDRALRAAQVIRIDHHVPVETMGQTEWIDQDASATCELVAFYFQARHQTIPANAAQYLYEGLIADNIRFTTSNTRPESFEAGRYLVEQGADVQRANEHNFAITLPEFYYENRVRERARFEKGALTSILSIEDYERCHLTFAQAKDKVYALSNIEEVKVWALFTEKTPGIYNASLRAKTLDIRQIATRFGGGGHACASGIKDLRLEQVEEIIHQLVALAQENEEENCERSV